MEKYQQLEKLSKELWDLQKALGGFQEACRLELRFGIHANPSEGSVLAKNPENESPPRTVDFSTKKSHF